jgi:NitT/TauT family transport system substrate-binding protein
VEQEERAMGTFRIQPHGRLQEWVADEKGYFRDEGLDYEFVHTRGAVTDVMVHTTETATPEVRQGAFESMEAGRACEVSSACHWAVNMAASAAHGRMYGGAYSITPAAIFVPPESSIRTVTDLAGVEVGVGYHSGSHFSALQALEAYLPPEQIRLRFIGMPPDRLAALLERRIPAANIFGIPYYLLLQNGFRPVVDTTFMIGFLISKDADDEDVEKFFRALRRAQVDIDLEPERYKHHFLKELPPTYRGPVDLAAFGTGERIVFEPYTREMYERTHRWMVERRLFPEHQIGPAAYERAVMA